MCILQCSFLTFYLKLWLLYRNKEQIINVKGIISESLIHVTGIHLRVQCKGGFYTGSCICNQNVAWFNFSRLSLAFILNYYLILHVVKR